MYLMMNILYLFLKHTCIVPFKRGTIVSTKNERQKSQG